jgi:DNA replication protein DnaC
MSSINVLMNNLEKLKLPKMKENINKYLDMMSDGVKTPLEAIDEMVQLEMKYREDLAVVSCVKVANFPFQRSLQDFDFSFQPSLDRKKIEDLATLRFIENCENIIICGTPGVGKTHLAVGIGTEAAKQRYSVYCISFHDLIAQLRKAKYENRLERRIKWICRYKLLIVGTTSRKSTSQTEISLLIQLLFT